MLPSCAMRFGFLHHLVLYAVINTGLFLLNMAPVGFDFDRPGVPKWFLYPLAGWGVLLVAHGVLVALGIQLTRGGAAGPVPPPDPEASLPTPLMPSIDPAKAGRAGELLAECRLRSGATLAALGAVGGVPGEVDDLLRGALDQAEHLAELLAPVYQALADGDDPKAQAAKETLEGRLEALHLTLEILRLEADVLREQSSSDLAVLGGPLEQLREAVMAAAETLAEQG